MSDISKAKAAMSLPATSDMKTFKPLDFDEMERKQKAREAKASAGGKRYTLYRFPAFGGDSLHFNSKTRMRLHAMGNPGPTYEYRDHKTGKYHAYWV